MTSKAAPDRLPLDHPLFRSEALEAFRRGDAIAPVLRVVTPKLEFLVVLTLGFLVAMVIACIVIKVEVTGTTYGNIGTRDDTLSLQSSIAGHVSEVLVRPGERVVRGQPIVELDSAELRAELVAVDSLLASAQKTLEEFGATVQPHFEEAVQAMRRQAALIGSKQAQHRKLLILAREDARRMATLQREGLNTAQDVSVADTRAYERRLSQSSEKERLTIVEAEIATLERARAEQLSLLHQKERELAAERLALNTRLEQRTICASADGLVDLVSATPGQRLEAGASVARLLQKALSRQVTLLVSEADRPFVVSGGQVRLELDGFPSTEFGYLTARIDRVSTHPASAVELPDEPRSATARSAFYEALATIDEASSARLARQTRVGARVQGKLILRRTRVIALLLQTVDDWL